MRGWCAIRRRTDDRRQSSWNIRLSRSGGGAKREYPGSALEQTATLKGPADKNRRRIWSAQDEKLSRHGDCLRVCTYNCRTIASIADRTILMEASKRLRFDVIALQETKAKETATRKTNDGHLIVLGAKLSGRNVGGVGFLVHHRLEHMVDSVEVIGPRLAILRLRIDKRTFWSLLDVSVVDAFRTGSDHRLVRAKIRLRARIRRRDFFRPPPIRLPHYDTNAMETAAAHYTWQEAQDLSQDYTMLIEGLRHCAMASAITTRTDSNGRIDDKARALLQQRAVVHRNPASTPLERAIEEWEVEHALRQMKPGKAPGPDRISVDFLKSASRT
ncbi:hypothetical protein COOONC_16704, partial [Cooperia oncophora]